MLNGTVEVNGVAIAKWEANNVGDVMKNVPKYECRVWYRNHEGYPHYAEFDIIHPQSLGALVLAERVLGTAPRHYRAWPLGTDKEFPV